MDAHEVDYGERLRRSASVSDMVVRCIYTVIILMLAAIAAMLYLHNECRSRAETAYFHLADAYITGEIPAFDSKEGETGFITTAEKLGLTSSDWWEQSARVERDHSIHIESRLCSPVFDRLNIEIQASFPETGNE